MRSRLLPLTFVVLLAMALTFVLPNLATYEWGQVLFLVVMIVLLMIVGIRLRAERRLPILCDPMLLFFAFQAQFFVIGPLALPMFDFSAFRVSHEETIAVLCGFLLVLTTFIAGYQLHLGAMIASWLPDFRRGRLKAPGRWFEIVIIMLSLFGCVVYILDLGGLAETIRNSYGRSKSSTALFLLPLNALMLCAFLMAWRLITSRTRSLADVGSFFLLLIAEVLFFGFVYGARKQLFFLFFGLFAVWLLHHPLSKLPRYVALFLIPPLLLYFSLWGTARSRSIQDIAQGHTMPGQVQKHAFYSGYLSSVAEPFAVACLVHNVFPRTEPFRYGSTLLVTLYGPIPRFYWPDKPIGLGKDLTRYTLGVFYTPSLGNSITPTLVGDFYANLGWTGILLGGLLYGIGCRMGAAYAAEGMERGAQKNPARVLIAAVFLAGLVEVRSDTAALLAFYFITYPVLLLGLVFFDFDYAGALKEQPAPAQGHVLPSFDEAPERI